MDNSFKINHSFVNNVDPLPLSPLLSSTIREIGRLDLPPIQDSIHSPIIPFHSPSVSSNESFFLQPSPRRILSATSLTSTVLVQQSSSSSQHKRQKPKRQQTKPKTIKLNNNNNNTNSSNKKKKKKSNYSTDNRQHAGNNNSDLDIKRKQSSLKLKWYGMPILKQNCWIGMKLFGTKSKDFDISVVDTFGNVINCGWELKEVTVFPSSESFVSFQFRFKSSNIRKENELVLKIDTNEDGSTQETISIRSRTYQPPPSAATCSTISLPLNSLNQGNISQKELQQIMYTIQWVNQPSILGRYPLHRAARGDLDFYIMEILINHLHADVNQLDDDGHYPLDIGLHSQVAYRAVQLLVDSSANSQLLSPENRHKSKLNSMFHHPGMLIFVSSNNSHPGQFAIFLTILERYSIPMKFTPKDYEHLDNLCFLMPDCSTDDQETVSTLLLPFNNAPFLGHYLSQHQHKGIADRFPLLRCLLYPSNSNIQLPILHFLFQVTTQLEQLRHFDPPMNHSCSPEHIRCFGFQLVLLTQQGYDSHAHDFGGSIFRYVSGNARN